jgi:hypothetical protein
MTCEDLDAYTRQVQAHHSLSSEEQKFLKKYRRQIRNRECAQNMRARKRQYTETLEGTIDGLQQKVKQEGARANRAEKERDVLQERVRYLEGVLRDRSIPFDAPPRLGRGLVAAGSLMAVMFSLAVFFGPMVAPGAPPPMPIPGGEATAADLFGPLDASSSGTGTGRELLVKEADLSVQAALEEGVAVGGSPLKHLVRSAPVRAGTSELAGSAPKRIPIVEQGPTRIRAAATGTQLQERSEKSALMVSPSVRQHSAPSAFDAKFDRPDTEYMYCPAVHSISSTHKGGDDAGDDFPSRVSLIIPGDAFNNSNLFQNMDPQPPLVEVSCSVVDIWPVWPEGTNPRVAP